MAGPPFPLPASAGRDPPGLIIALSAAESPNLDLAFVVDLAHGRDDEFCQAHPDDPP